MLFSRRSPPPSAASFLRDRQGFRVKLFSRLQYTCGFPRKLMSIAHSCASGFYFRSCLAARYFRSCACNTPSASNPADVSRPRVKCLPRTVAVVLSNRLKSRTVFNLPLSQEFMVSGTRIERRRSTHAEYQLCCLTVRSPVPAIENLPLARITGFIFSGQATNTSGDYGCGRGGQQGQRCLRQPLLSALEGLARGRQYVKAHLRLATFASLM